MGLSQVSFETRAAPVQDPALGMDVVCFLGLAAPRSGPVGADLAAWWAGRGYLDKDERENGPRTVLNRPVPLRSASDYAAVFQPGTRLDIAPRITGAGVPDPVPVQTDPLLMVIDGDLIEIDLPEAEVSRALVAAHIENAAPVTCSLVSIGSDTGFALAPTDGAQPGTFAVLAHPGLGFERDQHLRTRAVGVPMEAAIQQFYAMGGREAYAISIAAPPPLFSGTEERAGALAGLMGLEANAQDQALLTSALAAGLPPAHIPAAELSGLTHLYGLEDAAFLVLPDLPDLVALDRRPVPDPAPDLRPLAEFADCLPPASEPAAPPLARVSLPTVDAQGAALWTAALDRCLRLLTQTRRDVHLLASLPLGAAGLDVIAQAPRSAFLQLAAPFVRTPFSEALPMRAMGADAALAGELAAQELSDTPFASPASRPLAGVRQTVGTQGSKDAPVTWIKDIPGGATLTRDITASADPAWRAGGASRLAAKLIRLANEFGADILFEPISDRLMARVARAFTALLERVAAQGGLTEGRDDPGFAVACDRRTTTAHDIERGVLRAEIMVRPAGSIEEIRVSLPLSAQEGTP